MQVSTQCVCVLTANVLYNMCESVAVSSCARRCVYISTVDKKTPTYVHAGTHAQTVQVLRVVSGGEVKSTSTVRFSATSLILFSVIRPLIEFKCVG